MSRPSLHVIDLSVESKVATGYDNHPLTQVNDHEVRISTMFEAYDWHCHPDSDECFLAIEGGLFIDFDDETVALRPGQLITVPRGVRHRTRPMGERSVNITFERANAGAERLEAPQA